MAVKLTHAYRTHYLDDDNCQVDVYVEDTPKQRAIFVREFLNNKDIWRMSEAKKKRMVEFILGKANHMDGVSDDYFCSETLEECKCKLLKKHLSEINEVEALFKEIDKENLHRYDR